MKVLLCLITLLLSPIALSPIALADSYLGFGSGIGDISEEDVDDNANLLYIYAGHEITDYLSVDISYIKSSSFDTKDPDYDKLYVDAWMPMLSLYYFGNDLKLFVSAGAALWQFRFNEKGSAINDESTDLALGAGFEYRPGKWGLRAEYRYVEIDGEIIGEGVVRNILVGLSRYF